MGRRNPPNFYAVLRELRDAAQIWQLDMARQTELLPKPPQCVCDPLVGNLMEWETVAALAKFDLAAAKRLHEAAVWMIAGGMGWKTLRGQSGRRQLIEQLMPAPPSGGRGRPREIYLTHGEFKWAESFLDHARVEGLDHVRRQLTLHVVLFPSVVTDTTITINVLPLISHEGVQAALSVIGEVVAKSDAEYRRRRRKTAERVLSALLGASGVRIRQLSPGVARSPALLVEVPRVLRNIPSTPVVAARVRDLQKANEDASQETPKVAFEDVKRIAERKGMTPEEVLREFDKRLKEAHERGWV